MLPFLDLHHAREDLLVEREPGWSERHTVALRRSPARERRSINPWESSGISAFEVRERSRLERTAQPDTLYELRIRHMREDR